jgi:Uma2 family endonuclease
MSTTSTAPPVPAPEFLEHAGFRRFSVDEYHRMIQQGILAHGEPVELLEGWMVKKTSHGTPHDSAMGTLEGLLLGLLPSGWFPRSQRAVTLADSEPEPDLAVVRGPRGRYRDAHPTPADIAILIEVSDSSLRTDRVGKGRIYARASVANYWIVNVEARVIEVYSQPSGPGALPAYAQRTDYATGASVPVVLDGTTVGSIAVSDVFG